MCVYMRMHVSVCVCETMCESDVSMCTPGRIMCESVKSHVCERA